MPIVSSVVISSGTVSLSFNGMCNFWTISCAVSSPAGSGPWRVRYLVYRSRVALRTISSEQSSQHPKIAGTTV